MKYRITLFTLILSLLFAVGCTSTGLESAPDGTTGAPTIAPETPTEASPELEEGDLESMDNPELSAGEVPQDLFDSVLADLLSQTGADRSAVNVVSAEATTWNDGSLGCPQPDVMYTQALVDGFKVVFDVGGETYDYHLSDSGQFVLCTN